MTVMDRPRNKTLTCMCGGTMVQKVDTVTRVVRGQEIRIHKAPFYECLSCGEREFDLSAKIADITVSAYKLGKHDVVWAERE